MYQWDQFNKVVTTNIGMQIFEKLGQIMDFEKIPYLLFFLRLNQIRELSVKFR